MSEAFEPRNELEKSLLAAQEEKISSPERAKEFISGYPGFGVALNPGLDVGFDMEPETVNELVDSLGQKARH